MAESWPQVDGRRPRSKVLMLKNPGYGSPRIAIALGINERRAARVITSLV